MRHLFLPALAGLVGVTAGCSSSPTTAARAPGPRKKASLFRVINLGTQVVTFKSNRGNAVATLEPGKASPFVFHPRGNAVVTVDYLTATTTAPIEFKPGANVSLVVTAKGKGVEMFTVAGEAERSPAGAISVYFVNALDSTASFEGSGGAPISVAPKGYVETKPASGGSLKVTARVGANRATADLTADDGSSTTVVLTGTLAQPKLLVLQNKVTMKASAAGVGPAGG